MTFLDIFLNHLHIFKLSFDCFYIFQLQFGYFTSFLVCFVSLIEVDSLYYNYVLFSYSLPFSESHQKPLPRCLRSSKDFVKLLFQFTTFNHTSATSFKIRVRLNQYLRTTNKLQDFLQQLKMYSAVDVTTRYYAEPRPDAKFRNLFFRHNPLS